MRFLSPSCRSPRVIIVHSVFPEGLVQCTRRALRNPNCPPEITDEDGCTQSLLLSDTAFASVRDLAAIRLVTELWEDLGLPAPEIRHAADIADQALKETRTVFLLFGLSSNKLVMRMVANKRSGGMPDLSDVLTDTCLGSWIPRHRKGNTGRKRASRPFWRPRTAPTPWLISKSLKSRRSAGSALCTGSPGIIVGPCRRPKSRTPPEAGISGIVLRHKCLHDSSTVIILAGPTAPDTEEVGKYFKLNWQSIADEAEESENSASYFIRKLKWDKRTKNMIQCETDRRTQEAADSGN